MSSLLSIQAAIELIEKKLNSKKKTITDVFYTVFQKKFTLLLFAITKSDVD